MPGNKRINYSCLALAYCKQKPIDGVKSVGLSFSREISNIYARGSSTPVATYGNLPDIELSYSSHVTASAGFLGFNNEPGLNDFISFDMLIGSDTSQVLTTPYESIRLSYMLLSSITYNLNVNGPFSIDRTFKGWNKSSDCDSNQGKTSSSASILYRPGFTMSSSSLPSLLANTAIQNIKISMTINRSLVNEFSTRKPYASYINFPIETTCTFDTLILDKLDTFNFNALDTACKNSSLYSEDIKIATCTGHAPIEIKKTTLTSFDYSGAEAQQGGSNLQLSLTYTGFQSPAGISPVVYLDDANLSDPCAC